MKECKECAVYKKVEYCPYDFKHSKLKSKPNKTREAYIKQGYTDCFWTQEDVKKYIPKKEK